MQKAEWAMVERSNEVNDKNVATDKAIFSKNLQFREPFSVHRYLNNIDKKIALMS